MILSGIIMIAGLLLLTTVSPETPRWLLTLYMVIVGLGVGFSFSVLNMAVIHPFSIQQRGSATSTFNFIRSLGMTIGTTIFGVIQRNSFSGQLQNSFGYIGSLGEPSADPHTILSEGARAHIPPKVLKKIIDVLSSSIVHTFAWALVPAGIAFLLVFLLGKERMRSRKDTNFPGVEASQ